MEEYRGTVLKQVLRVGKVYTIHYFRYGLRFNVPGESHDFWEMVYIDAGEAEVLAGERTVKLRQGEAIFHRPNEFHNIRTRNKFTASVILSFDCAGEEVEGLGDRIVALTEGEQNLLREIVTEGAAAFSDRLNLVELKEMTRRERAPFGGEQIIRNDLENLLLSILRRPDGPPLPGRPADQEGLASSAETYLRQNLRRRVTLDELSEKLHFSKTYIKEVFRRERGTSVMQAFNRMKVEEAKLLIAAGKRTLTQIAYELGFSSAAHFSRVFKRYADLAPSEYARTVRVENLL